MADDGYIQLVAKLNEVKSKNNIQEQLNRIQGDLQLHLSQLSVTKAGISNLQRDIDSIQKNLSLNISNVHVSSQEVQKAFNAQKGAGNVTQLTGDQNVLIERAKAAFNTITKDSIDLQTKMQKIFGDVGKVTTSFVTNSQLEIENFTVSVTKANGIVEKFKFGLLDNTAGYDFLGLNSVDKSVEKINNNIPQIEMRMNRLRETLAQSVFTKNDTNSEVIKAIEILNSLSSSFESFKVKFAKNAKDGVASSELVGTFEKIKALSNQALQAVGQLRIELNQQSQGADFDREVTGLKTLLNNLKSSGVATQELISDYMELIAILKQTESTGDFTTYFAQLDAFKAKFMAAKSEVRATNSEIADLDKMAKQLSGTKLTNFFNKNSGNVQTDTLRAEVQTLVNEWDQLNTEIQTTGKITPELQTKIDALRVKMQSADQSAKTLQAEIKGIADAQKLATQRQSLDTRITTWLQNNTAATHETKTALLQLQSQIEAADSQTLTNLTYQFRKITSEAVAAGQAGRTFGDIIREKFAKFSGWFSISTVVMRSVQAIRQMAEEVVELDTALVDLRKTTDATNAQLEDFYVESNKIGKNLGVTTKEVIQAASSWSRLGYSIKDAQEMAKTSAIFASISPNVDINMATDGLVSAMKAYGITAQEALDGIASKINVIGNTQAVSNQDIVEFLTRSSSAMAEANNSLEETIALGTAITEITRDAAGAGQVLKTVSMRIRGRSLPPYMETYMRCA